MFIYILFTSLFFSINSFCLCPGNKELLVLFQECKNFCFADDVVLSNSSDAIVRTVLHSNKNKYIVKQIVDNDIDEQFLLIRDLIASFIATVCDILVNRVYLIPAYVKSGVKTYGEFAATIHTFVEGKSLEQTLPDFLCKDFTVQQRYCDPNPEWQKKWPVSINQQGLTRQIIESMAKHPDLVEIVAFDTFVGNADRSLPNIFYKKKEKRFYGIDNAAAFNNKNMANLATQRLQVLYQSGYFDVCDTSVINALKRYKDMLQKLYNKITPEYVCFLFKVGSSHIYVWSEEFAKHIHGRCYYHCQAFASNYTYTKELIALLDKVVQNTKELGGKMKN